MEIKINDTVTDLETARDIIERLVNKEFLEKFEKSDMNEKQILINRANESEFRTCLPIIFSIMNSTEGKLHSYKFTSVFMKNREIFTDYVLAHSKEINFPANFIHWLSKNVHEFALEHFEKDHDLAQYIEWDQDVADWAEYPEDHYSDMATEIMKLRTILKLKEKV